MNGGSDDYRPRRTSYGNRRGGQNNHDDSQ
jgi:hypothetical protein